MEEEILLPKINPAISKDNLIFQWQRYGEMTQDSYPEYHFASMMVLVSHLVKAEIRLRSAPVRNNMWCIILGSSGRSGKSTACDALMAITYTEELAPYVNHLTGKLTTASLLLSLKEQPNRLHYFDEASGFLKTLEKEYNGDLGYDWIKAYNGQGLSERVIGRSRETSKEEFVASPRLSVLWATTMDSFSEHATRGQFADGFFLRPFFIIQTREKPIKPDDDLDPAAMDLRDDLIQRLANLCRMIGNRKVVFSKPDYIVKWKFRLRQKTNDLKNMYSDIEQSTMVRVYDQAYKTAMNLTLASKEFYEYVENESKDNEGNLVGLVDIHCEIPEDIAKLACKIAEDYFFYTSQRAYRLTTMIGKFADVIKRLEEGQELSRTDIGNIVGKSGRQLGEFIADLVGDYPNIEEIERLTSLKAKKKASIYRINKSDDWIREPND